MDTLNFAFWHYDDAVPYVVKYRDCEYTGYWALCAAVNRTVEVSKSSSGRALGLTHNRKGWT